MNYDGSIFVLGSDVLRIYEDAGNFSYSEIQNISSYKYNSWPKISLDGNYVGCLVSITKFKVFERIDNVYT